MLLCIPETFPRIVTHECMICEYASFKIAEPTYKIKNKKNYLMECTLKEMTLILYTQNIAISE